MEASDWRAGYAGPESEAAFRLFDELTCMGISVKPSRRTNSTGKTLRISDDHKQLGFFNDDVKKHNCVFGFSFEDKVKNKANDAWPVSNEERAVEQMASTLGCDKSVLVSRKDKGRFFFYFKEPEAAKRAIELRRSGIRFSVC